MGNAGSFVALVAQFCGVGFPPLLATLFFLSPLPEPLFDQTLFLIPEEEKMLVQPFTGANNAAYYFSKTPPRSLGREGKQFSARKS